MSEVKVNKISPRTNCGTVTLGDSGDSFVIPSGATITNNGTQTGFGRTGTVDWQTSSIKTATFTAANGEGYFANTSGGAFTMNLPAGTAGNIVSVVDYTNTFQTNALTIAPNGSQKLGGINASFVAGTEGQSLTFVYVDDTEGWKNVQDSTSNATGSLFMAATGGTITTCGNDKIHTFTGPGTFAVSRLAQCAANNVLSYVVVAGGGGGGIGDVSGGGGAGGFREVKSPATPYTASPLDGYPSSPNRITATVASFPIAVGGGGAAGATTPPGSNGTNGVNSTFSTITAAGGGGGSRGCASPPTSGSNGGSGGGAGYANSTVGSGNTPPTTPPQGQNGGGNANPSTGPAYGAGGGGGAGAVGGNGSPSAGGVGGNGVASSISGSSVTRSGGGGGARNDAAPGGAGGSGGGGIGGGNGSGHAAGNGTANTGGGGGGLDNDTPSGGTGGSGIVIIRYKFQ